MVCSGSAGGGGEQEEEEEERVARGRVARSPNMQAAMRVLLSGGGEEEREAKCGKQGRGTGKTEL